jgi:phospholipid transport system substrate-binding protein
MTRRPLAAILLATSVFGTPSLAVPAGVDPAAIQVEGLDHALLESMRAGTAMNSSDRYQMLAPTIERTFDLPAMTAFAVGAVWSTFTPAQQKATIVAFSRLTISSYTHNFRTFAGERFEVDPAVVARGSDRIVQTHLLLPHDAPVSLVYRMRESGGAWKIIDVYYGAISQLTMRRSDFAASLATGGSDSLIAHLNLLSDDLLK